uniref:Uncharacterized protein n=1 Tax=Solanum lycopersicum TaxID=4081 RepID=K4C3X5_SOLLC
MSEYIIVESDFYNNVFRHFDVLHNVKKDMLPRETIASIVHTVKNWLGVTIVSLHLKIYFLIFLLYIKEGYSILYSTHKFSCSFYSR